MVSANTPPVRVPVPMLVAPSRNVTVPVALDGVTVAVSVTKAPYVEGFREEIRPVEVPLLPMVTEKVCDVDWPVAVSVRVIETFE